MHNLFVIWEELIRFIMKKSITINFIMNVVLTMSSFIFPLITFPYISRILLPEGTGKVTFATSVVAYFSMFAQLGIPTYGIRACAKVRDNKKKLSQVANELLAINLITSFLSIFALAMAVCLVPRLNNEKLLYIIMSMSIFLTALGMEWLYKALEQYTYITIRSIVFKFVALVFMFLLVHSKSDYVIYGAISIFASSASNLCNFVNAHKYINIIPLNELKLQKHFPAVLVFFAMSCATTVYTNLDTVMLGFMATDADVGYYNAAVKIKGILVALVTSLGAVILPRASYYVENNRIEEFYKITQKTLQFVFLVSVPLMVYFIIFAKEGILFLSGSAYIGAVFPMQLIMPTLLLIGITNVLGMQILIPLGKEKCVLYSELFGAFVDIVINAILIPKCAAAGAAIGTLIAEAVVLAVQCFFLRDKIHNLFFGIGYVMLAEGVFLSAVTATLIKCLNICMLVKLLISFGVFFGVYIGWLLYKHEALVIEVLQTVFKKISCKC